MLWGGLYVPNLERNQAGMPSNLGTLNLRSLGMRPQTEQPLSPRASEVFFRVLRGS